ncbi:MAG: lysozyme inhibitor LprI family protein [Bacteroidota bacterium]
MRYLYFIFVILIITSCSGNHNEVEPCTSFDAIDLEMLNLIEEIKQNFTDRSFKKKFDLAQVSWIQYRDRHIRAIYPKDMDRDYRKVYGREEFNNCKCQELIRMTRIRIEQLKMFVDGGPKDQADCPSEWNK